MKNEENKNSSIGSIVFLNSLSIALIINAQFLSYIANLFLGISGGVVTSIYIVSIGLVLIGAIIQKGKLKIRINKINVLLMVFVFLAFLLSFLFAPGKGVQNYFSDFIATGLVTFFVIHNKFSNRYVLIINMMMGLFFCINPSRYINASLLNISYDRASMFASYILVPIILSGIYHFLFFREKRIYLYFLYCVVGFTFLRTVTILGRGPLFSIVLGIIIAFLLRNENKWDSRSNKQKIRYVLLIVVGAIFVFWGEELLSKSYSLLNETGIQVAALKKSMDLLNSSQSGLLHNRNIRWNWALDMIIDNPIFGNGIGSYYDKYQTWPHNLILQLLVEKGVIGAIPILVIFIRNLYWLFFKKIDKEDVVLISFLFAISVPRLMVSSYYWHHPEFWMFMYLCVICIEKYKKNNGEKKNENRNINFS